ncbi:MULTISPECIES: hypothetical protein [unclassified Sphingobacterium]|uniref:DUF6965 family protein n=1 Tax=unclassified Sphingobacterium TaxID=2609468 RepID=UPI00265D5A8B|nr:MULTISPECIES: hypothetical protein [unclassified Sphingobacterium]WKK60034.1 hypothetical protein QYC40_07255 [Sphingobacterium sp. BN32]
MTLAELRAALLGKSFPESVQINSSSTVTESGKFLAIQFADCERWTRELEKCPAYIRLVQFYEATK